ncbi:protein-disulfide reductase DsbD family protein [Chryseosolibacter indicus]|uniref:Thioredoxin family protein n=1 Tax=Chryseosolibacter indicus TaxID=2782351 RepID=A0ABS5VSF5_9BACT|nr:cytochrome c biogenesis protein CcdA [Chryseosolibacter indicus]MBT1704368.1 thioredoxin family protein [Chryseosolibacter indicus]
MRLHLVRLTLLALILLPATLFGQVLQPAKWTTEVSKTKVKSGDIIELIFKAKIDDKWYMYANDFDPDCGPLLTELSFSDAKNFEVVGKTIAVNPSPKHDEVFDCDVKVFKKTAEFRQKVRVLGGTLKIAGSIQGQVCTEVDGKCIPFEEEFSFDNIEVTGAPAQQSPTKQQSNNLKDEKPAAQDQSSSNNKNNSTNADTLKTAAAATMQAPSATSVKSENKGPILDPTILQGEAEQQDSSIAGYMVLAFLLGLTSLITPCVFPMIPMTVTFFLKDNQSKKEGIRNAIIFGVSIIVIYTIAGTLFALLFGAEGLNALATHWLPNLFVFFMFIVFALSFLGLFEINAPYKLVNKADRAAEKGGLVGVFFMSATLVLVSFSCTIPIVGNVLVLSAGGEVIKPVLGMLAYSAAFAIPFTLFAIFPEWMKSMPKSGGWLNSVKVTLGLLELALALKFLSIVDQTYHWGILDRDVNIAIWIVIFSLLGLYFLGKIRTSSDTVTDKVSVPKLMLAIVTFSFVVYLIPGLCGAPLKALAGYLPPMYTHDFNLLEASKDDKANQSCEEPKYGEFLHLPHGINGYFDYDQALACARQQNKPLFIDFTGHGCTNCREMEAIVWSDPEVLKRLKEDYVVVALYVDDKTELPEQEWYTSRHDNRVKKTIGKQNADLQITNLNNNAQPFYVLVGKDERVLAWPKAYDRSIENFKNFLDSGKKTYNQLYAN